MGSTTSLQLIASKALPALSGANVIYNAAKNIFLAGAYTSAAGNTYYKAIRFSDRLVVYYDIGEGYCHKLPQWYTLVCMGWTESKTHCKEIMGRMLQLSLFQRADCKRGKHPDAEGFLGRSGKVGRIFRKLSATAGFLTQYD